MNGARAAVAWPLLALALVAVGRAAPPQVAQTEINHLLGSIENSTCEFFRNGTWYDGKKAAAHLRDKYALLAAENRVRTAEDFIEEAATKSSASGQPYQIRCSGGKAVPTNPWLRDMLARYRAGTGLRAPRSGRGALGAGAIALRPDYQSSCLILMSLCTALTCSVSRAMDRAMSAACWDRALPVSHTTPSLSVSTWMRPRLVRCSAASLVLIAAVMAESFTNTPGCERSVSESWATTTAGDAIKVPKSTQLIANVGFMLIPQSVNQG
jgi:uncharacterized protein DUF5329